MMRRQAILTVSMVILLMGAPIAGIPFTSVDSPVESVSAADGEGEVITTGETDLDFWDRSVLPLRPESEQSSAEDATLVRNLNLNLQPDGVPQSASANRDELAVYETGTVTLEFTDGPDFADVSQFENEGDTELLVGYLEEDTSGGVDTSDLPTSGEEFLEELTQENLDDLNENVTFTRYQGEDVADAPLDYGVDASDSGIYFAVLAVPDNGPVFEVNNGDIDPPNAGTVIGVDQFATQDANSEVSHPDSVEPGDDIVFDVEATEFSATTETDHAVVVYDADTFENSDMTVIANEPFTTDFSTGDLTIEHDIAELNGVQNVEDDVTFAGLTLNDRTETGVTTLADVIDFLAQEADANEPNTVPGTLTLNTSMTVISDADANDEVTVETFDNWTEGEYQWVHIAAGESSDQIQSQEGTISIQEVDDDDDDDPPRRGGGGGGAPPADDDDEPTETPTPEPAPETPTETPDDDEVEPPETEPPADDDDTIPGFGVTVAIVALLSIALLALRRNE